MLAAVPQYACDILAESSRRACGTLVARLPCGRRFVLTAMLGSRLARGAVAAAWCLQRDARGSCRAQLALRIFAFHVKLLHLGATRASRTSPQNPRTFPPTATALRQCWATTTRDANNNTYAELDHFPNGLKPVIDYVHSKGLSFGLYTCGGTQTCVGGRVGSMGFWQKDADSYASWGVDWVKMASRVRACARVVATPCRVAATPCCVAASPCRAAATRALTAPTIAQPLRYTRVFAHHIGLVQQPGPGAQGRLRADERGAQRHGPAHRSAFLDLTAARAAHPPSRLRGMPARPPDQSKSLPAAPEPRASPPPAVQHVRMGR